MDNMTIHDITSGFGYATVAEDPFADVTVQARPVAALKDVPVPPASVITLAQQALDGTRLADGKLTHVKMHTFSSADRASLFARHMKNAGSFTSPPSSVKVTVTEGGLHVRWRAVKARARKVDAAAAV